MSDAFDDEALEADPEVFEDLKKKWSNFFVDNVDTLVVGEKIGEGAQAEIFAAHWPGQEGGKAHWPGREGGIVLKVFKKGTLLQDLRELFPIGFLKYVDHAEVGSWNPRLCHIHAGVILKDGRFAFAMERYWGDLRSLIESIMRITYKCPPFPIWLAKRIMLEIAEGMQALHEMGVVHRDVKAKNIYVKCLFDIIHEDQKESSSSPIKSFDDTHGDTDTRIKALEKVLGTSEFSCCVGDFESSVGVVGTGFFKAPEILRAIMLRNIHREEPTLFTEKSDVYSYSMTCCEILTGDFKDFQDVPVSFIGDLVLSGRRPELPETTDPAVKALLSRCWDSDPLHRPTFVEICEQLKTMM